MKLNRRSFIAIASALPAASVLPAASRIDEKSPCHVGYYPLRVISNGKELSLNIDYSVAYLSQSCAKIEILRDGPYAWVAIVDNYGLKVAAVLAHKTDNIYLDFPGDYPNIIVLSDGKWSAEVDRRFEEHMRATITSGRMRDRPDLLAQS